MEKSRHHEDFLLATRCVQGDEEAMRMLYETHHQKLYAMALRLTGSRSDADDVVQDSFVRAFRFMHSYRGESAIGTWLCRIAINVSRDLHKQKGRFTEEAEPTLGHTQEDPMAKRRLEDALSRLPGGYREILVMHDVLGMGHEEISQVLEIQEGTSKSQLHKARGKMRELMAMA